MNKLTDLGTLLYLYRDKDKETLRAQARKLGISAAYLTDISYGNRNLSGKLADLIVKTYEPNKTDLSIILEAHIGSDIFERAQELGITTENLCYLFLGVKV